MIQTLPLLPSTYGQWDWAKSNGSASIDQTKLSYQTLLDKGLCSSFSRFVWNDIVDMTANALSAAGIEWDSTYGSSDDCKIGQFLGALTASKFNGVALNINIMGLFSWKWAAARNITGYVGRDNFYGVSTHGKNADNIYAWYIIELTKKLNWLIGFLKNESDFSEFQKNLVIESAAPVTLSSIEDIPLRTSVGNTSYGFAGLVKVGVVSTGSQESCYSESNCILIPNNAVYRLSSDVQIVSAVEASGGSIFACSIPHRSATANTITNATLNKSIVTRYLRYSNQSKSAVLAMMEANILDMFSSLCSIGNFIANLSSLPPTKFASQLFSESLSNPSFVSIPAGVIVSNIKSESMSFSKLYSHSSLRFDVKTFADTLSSSEITIKTISPLRYASKDDTILKSVIHTLIAISMPSKEEVCVNYVANGAVAKSAALKYTGESKFVSVDDMAACSASALKSTKHIQAKFDGKCVSAIAKPCAATLCANGYDSSPELSPCVPIRVVSHDIAYSHSDAVIQSGVPLIVESANESISDVNGLIVNVPKQILESKEISVDKHSAAMCQRRPAVYSALSMSYASINASMELEYNAPDLWRNPVRNGNNLHIRSVYPQWQEENIVHLDSGGVFYEAEQTENEVYIKSVGNLEGV